MLFLSHLGSVSVKELSYSDYIVIVSAITAQTIILLMSSQADERHDRRVPTAGLLQICP